MFILSDTLHSPVNPTYNMISVGNDLCFRETGLRNPPEVRIHITNKILYICFIGELGEITNQITLITIGKDIQNSSILGISNDAVILLASGIALELIQRDYFRKCGKLLVEQVKITHGSNGRHVKAAADFFCRNELLEREHDLCNKPVGNSVVIAGQVASNIYGVDKLVDKADIANVCAGLGNAVKKTTALEGTTQMQNNHLQQSLTGLIIYVLMVTSIEVNIIS